ncbi:GNAT family N-acetyltransferase [Nafulsella turpanensis]|uniref:GNAT family N-acetyltransferase n=1 Tax=Nafulsella turpanensis TaxID=1265690 RepID=UPI000346C2BC|nr:GNAT family protein [Nafulsella turpanensis]
MHLITRHLSLEELKPGDIADVHQLHSLPETDHFNTLGIPAGIEETQQLVEQWLKLQQEEPQQSYVFCLKEKEKQTFAGLGAITLGKPKYRIGEIWYKVHPNFWGRGYATETAFALLNFGFNTLRLHRIEAGCAVENVASARVLEKAGMLCEGSKRKVLPIRGQWVDNYEYAILEEDFRQQE